MSWMKWALYGAGTMLVLLLLWHAKNKYDMNRLHKEAIASAAQVGIVRNFFAYNPKVLTLFRYPELFPIQTN